MNRKSCFGQTYYRHFFSWFPKAAWLLIGLVSWGLYGFHSFDNPSLHVIQVNNAKELQDFFRYTPDRRPFISSHRGGPSVGFPENCLATFENTLRHTWSILEIDPHFTKDSAIVLMHDATLDRTTNGAGKVSDYTLAELKKLRLKDTEGNVTDYSIPTLDEALEWAKGKTILVLDMKDVPMEARVKKIQEHEAQAHAIVMAYTLEDAKRCYAMDKNIMMEVFIPDKEAARKFEQTGIPWQNVVAFVTHTQPRDEDIYTYIHDKGAMCIVGSSRTIDSAFTEGKIDKEALYKGYQNLIASGVDIIEADLGVQAGEAIRNLSPENSSKHTFFTTLDLSAN